MRKTWLLVVISSLIGSAAITPAFGAVKAGSACTKAGATSTTAGKKFTCVKSGKKLVWNKGVTLKLQPSKAPASTKPVLENSVYREPQMASAAIDQCRIKEISNQGGANGDVAAGFPFVDRYSKYPSKIKMALIPIDFSDLIGGPEFKIDVAPQTQNISDWYSSVSGGKMRIEWVIGNNWIRLPGKSSEYAVPYSGAYPETTIFWSKVLPVVDTKFDLTGVHVINFILPNGQSIIKESVQSFPFLSEMKSINSSQTTLISFATAGEYFDGSIRNYWSYWAHEFGHVIGLAHIGSSRGESQVINGYDLMGNQDGPYRELSGWMRFIIGWLDDSQVYCQNVDELISNEISLVPLNENKPGIKMVVIPTSIDSAIVIESRRPTKFSCDIPNLPSGVLVYSYNAKLGNQSYFLEAKYPSGRNKNIRCLGNDRMEFYPDALLHKGDSIKEGKFEITVVSTGNVDQIKITKK